MSEPVRGSRVGLFVLGCWLGVELVVCGVPGVLAVELGPVGVLEGVLEVMGLEGVALDWAGLEGVGLAGVLGVGVSEGVDVSSGWEGVGVGHWHWHGHCSWHAGLAGPVAAWAVPAPASRTMLDAAAARVILVVFFTSDSYAGMDARVRACTGVGESGPARSVP